MDVAALTLQWRGKEKLAVLDRHPNSHTSSKNGDAAAHLVEDFLKEMGLIEHVAGADIASVTRMPHSHSKPIIISQMAADGRVLTLTSCPSENWRHSVQCRVTFKTSQPLTQRMLQDSAAQFNKKFEAIRDRPLHGAETGESRKPRFLTRSRHRQPVSTMSAPAL